MSSNQKNILSSQIIVEYIYVFALFIPEFFKTSGGIWNVIYWILEGIRIAGSIYFIFLVIARKRINQIFAICIVFELVFLAATIINKSNLSTYRTYINAAIPSLGIMALLECRWKKKVTILRHIKNVLEVLIFINLIYMLVYPDGVYITTIHNSINSALSREMTNYFLAGKNRLIMWVLPLAVVLEIERKEDRVKKVEYIFFVFFMFSTLVIARSITSLAALGLFYFGAVCFEKNRFIKLTIGKIAITYTIISLLFIVLNVQNYFSLIIVGVLGKNLLLQGRVYIWEIALQMIEEHFVLGYGNAGNGSIIQWNGYMWYAHNLALDIMIQGGIIALGIMIILICKLIAMEKATLKQPMLKYGSIQIVNLGLAAFLLLGVFESYLNYPQFFMIISLSSVCMKAKYVRFYRKDIK